MPVEHHIGGRKVVRPSKNLSRFTAMPNTAISTVVSTMRRQVGGIATFWREIKSTPVFAVIVLMGAFFWSYAMAWLVLPLR